jgi:hypothetical protein
MSSVVSESPPLRRFPSHISTAMLNSDIQTNPKTSLRLRRKPVLEAMPLPRRQLQLPPPRLSPLQMSS